MYYFINNKNINFHLAPRGAPNKLVNLQGDKLHKRFRLNNITRRVLDLCATINLLVSRIQLF